MKEPPDILSAEQMQRWYGDFYDLSPKVHLDRKNVPEQFSAFAALCRILGSCRRLDEGNPD